MTNPAPPSNFFPSIDILRGFAAVSVVVYLVIEHYHWVSFPTTGFLTWFRSGWMSIDLFFVISGFVIGLSTFAEIDRHREHAFRAPFIKRRISRIVPLHYLTCLVFVLLVGQSLVANNIWPNAVSHALFIHNWFPQLHGAINGVNWSLGTGMQFYLLMLLLAPGVRRARIWRLILLFTFTAWLWRYGSFFLISAKGPLDVFPRFTAATQLPGMVDEFLAGLLLARLLKNPAGPPLLLRLSKTGAATATILLTGLIIWAVMTLFWRHSFFWDNPLMVTFFRTLLANGLYPPHHGCLPLEQQELAKIFRPLPLSRHHLLRDLSMAPPGFTNLEKSGRTDCCKCPNPYFELYYSPCHYFMAFFRATNNGPLWQI